MITIVLASTSEKRTDQVFQRCRQGRKFDFDLLERKRCRWRLRFQSRSRNCNFRLFNNSINYFNSDKSRVFTSAIFFVFASKFSFFNCFLFRIPGNGSGRPNEVVKLIFIFSRRLNLKKRIYVAKMSLKRLWKVTFSSNRLRSCVFKMFLGFNK